MKNFQIKIFLTVREPQLTKQHMHIADTSVFAGGVGKDQSLSARPRDWPTLRRANQLTRPTAIATGIASMS